MNINIYVATYSSDEYSGGGIVLLSDEGFRRELGIPLGSMLPQCALFSTAILALASVVPSCYAESVAIRCRDPLLRQALVTGGLERTPELDKLAEWAGRFKFLWLMQDGDVAEYDRVTELATAAALKQQNYDSC